MNNNPIQPKEETLIEKIKRESTGYNLLDPEEEEKERWAAMGAWARVCSKFGPLTEEEKGAMNI